MVSDRRLRKAIERMQKAAAATYDKRISPSLQASRLESLRANGLKMSLTSLHFAGMRAVRVQFPTADVASQLLMEGACFEVLASRVGRPAGVLAPEIIYDLAVQRFKAAAEDFREGWSDDFRSMSIDELGMCFTYGMHSMLSDVGPWLGSDEDLWKKWHHTSQLWLADECGRESNAIILASANRRDPNEALQYAQRRLREQEAKDPA